MITTTATNDTRNHSAPSFAIDPCNACDIHQNPSVVVIYPEAQSIRVEALSLADRALNFATTHTALTITLICGAISLASWII